MRILITALTILLNFSATADLSSVPSEFVIQSHYFNPAYVIKFSDKQHYSINSNQSALSAYELFNYEDDLTLTADINLSPNPVELRIYKGNERVAFMDKDCAHHMYHSFYISAEDGKTRLIKGDFNYWGTKVTLKNVSTNQIFGEMNSNYFCILCDFNVKILDRSQFNNINVDKDVLMLSLGIQAEEWLSYHNTNPRDNDRSMMQRKRMFLENTYNKPSDAIVSEVVEELDKGFNLKYQDKTFANITTKSKSYQQYVLAYINNPAIDAQKRKTAETMLKLHHDISHD